MTTNHRVIYDSLLESGDLFDLDPEFTGDWEEDRKLFVEMQDSLDYITETQLYLDEEEQDQEDFD